MVWAKRYRAVSGEPVLEKVGKRGGAALTRVGMVTQLLSAGVSQGASDEGGTPVKELRRQGIPERRLRRVRRAMIEMVAESKHILQSPQGGVKHVHQD